MQRADLPMRPAEPPAADVPVCETRWRRLLRGTVLLLLLVLVSTGTSRCGNDVGEIRLDHPIKFDGPDGARSLKILPRPGMVKLEDGEDRLLARFKLVGERLEVERGEPRELLGFVARPPDGSPGIHILAPEQGKVRYRVLREPDGDVRLENGAGTLLYKLKKRDYGFKTVDARDRVQSRLRQRSSKVSVRDATGETTLSTDDPVSPAAAAFLTLGSLPVESRVALLLGVVHWGADSL